MDVRIWVVFEFLPYVFERPSILEVAGLDQPPAFRICPCRGVLRGLSFTSPRPSKDDPRVSCVDACCCTQVEDDVVVDTREEIMMVVQIRSAKRRESHTVPVKRECVSESGIELSAVALQKRWPVG